MQLLSLVSEEAVPWSEVIEVSFMGQRVWCPVLANSPDRGNVSLGCGEQTAHLPLKIQYNPLLVRELDSSIIDMGELLIYPSSSDLSFFLLI